MLNRKYEILVVIVRTDEFKILNWMLPTTRNNAVLKKKDDSEIKVESPVTLEYQENRGIEYCE